MCLLMAAIGMIRAGFTIQTIGMTCVFVPTDLTFMGLDRAQLDAINIRLVPLIAHDRAGFGGGVATAGLLLFASVWCAVPSLALAIAVAWRYRRLEHGDRRPPVDWICRRRASRAAVAGAILFFVGLALCASVHVRRGPTSELKDARLSG